MVVLVLKEDTSCSEAAASPAVGSPASPTAGSPASPDVSRAPPKRGSPSPLAATSGTTRLPVAAVRAVALSDLQRGGASPGFDVPPSPALLRRSPPPPPASQQEPLRCSSPPPPPGHGPSAGRARTSGRRRPAACPGGGGEQQQPPHPASLPPPLVAMVEATARSAPRQLLLACSLYWLFVVRHLVVCFFHRTCYHCSRSSRSLQSVWVRSSSYLRWL
jgi:hypothetical protein